MKFKCLLSSEPRRSGRNTPVFFKPARRAGTGGWLYSQKTLEHALEIWRNFRFLARARAAQSADVKGKPWQKGKKAGDSGRR